MKKLTLGDAAKRSGMSKATISKALKSGRLSGEKHPVANGRYEFRIDLSELDRVFPHKQNDEHKIEQTETQRNSTETAVLEAKLYAAERLIEELREDRDQWRQATNRLLSAPKANASKGWISRLFGK